MGHLHRRLIAFDLDGTLVDSRRDLAESANDLLTELGGLRLSVEAVTGMVGEGARVLVARALAASGLGVDLTSVPDAVERFLAFYDARLLDSTELYPGTIAAVEAARRVATVTVLTNKPRAHTERLLEGLSIRHLFDDVTGGDGPKGRKPDPGGLLAMMAQAGASPAGTLMVGDSHIDLETARAAGARCCLVRYGFGLRDVRIADGEWIVDDAAALARVIETFAAATTGTATTSDRQ